MDPVQFLAGQGGQPLDFPLVFVDRVQMLLDPVFQRFPGRFIFDHGALVFAQGPLLLAEFVLDQGELALRLLAFELQTILELALDLFPPFVQLAFQVRLDFGNEGFRLVHRVAFGRHGRSPSRPAFRPGRSAGPKAMILPLLRLSAPLPYPRSVYPMEEEHRNHPPLDDWSGDICSSGLTPNEDAPVRVGPRFLELLPDLGYKEREP